MNVEPAGPGRDGCHLTRAPRIRRIVEAGRKPKAIEQIVVTLIKDDEIWMIRVQFRLEPDQVVVDAVPGDTGIDDLDATPRKTIVEYSLKPRRPRRRIG